MSWKPCRGGNVLLDKAVKQSHELFFKFQETNDLKTKTKIAFQYYKAEEYLGNGKRTISFFGSDFLNKAKSSKETYKPFLRLIDKF